MQSVIVVKFPRKETLRLYRCSLLSPLQFLPNLPFQSLLVSTSIVGLLVALALLLPQLDVAFAPQTGRSSTVFAIAP